MLERGGYRIGETPPPAAVYAATEAGIFRSGSGDGDWVRVHSGLTSPAVTALAIFQRELQIAEPVVAHRTRVEYETTLYAGTGTAGVFRSTDSGATWRSINAGLTGLSVAVLLVDRAGAVYAATAEGGLFRSADRGERWTPAGPGLPKSIHSLAADPIRPGVLYAGAGAGLYRSDDGGKNWSALSVGGHDLVFIASSIAVDPNSPSTIFAAGNVSCRGCPTPVPAVFASGSGGMSWTRLARAVEGPLLFDRERPSLLYAAAGGGALATRDAGSTWTAVGDGAARPGAVLAVDPDWPGRLYGRAAAGGILRLDARCGSDAATLCLNDGRFRVQIDWDRPTAPKDGPQGALATTDETGSFWLARPSNVVLTVKIRDARSINGHFWLDFDTRTSRAFAVVVTDMATGTSTRYAHPEGQRTTFTDHAAF